MTEQECVVLFALRCVFVFLSQVYVQVATFSSESNGGLNSMRDRGQHASFAKGHRHPTEANLD